MSLFDELLMKARRDTSKLVKVQRSVTRNGKTFTQDYYVRPDQVKKTDKVIGNFQNLLPIPGSVPTPAKGMWDQKYFDSIKSDRAKALDYLKQCGVTWDETNNQGINWMRALMSMKKKFNVAKPAAPQAQTQPSQATSPNGNTAANVILDPAVVKELGDCKNGKEKVVVLKKKLGQQGCIDYAKSLGVTWDEHSHTAINIMRMSMALRDYFDQTDGTVSPVGTPGKGGAPKGNDNAKKDGAPQDDSLLPITGNTSPRKVNLINLINGITDLDEIKMYTGVGMVPEDDVAKSFIAEKLSPKYTSFKAAHNIGTSTGKKAGKVQQVSATSWGYADLITQHSNIEGCAKNILESAFSITFSRFKIASLTDPRSTLFWINSDKDDNNHHRPNSGFHSPQNIIENMIGAYSLYTTDEFTDKDDKQGYYSNSRYLTNMGYTGWDSEIYRKQYSREKDGFVRYLTSLVDQDPSCKDAVDQMVETYEELLDKVDYNIRGLSLMLSSYQVNSNPMFSPDWRSMFPRKYTEPNPEMAKYTLNEIQYQLEVIPKAIKRAQEAHPDLKIDVETTLKSRWNTSLGSYSLYNKDGDRVLDIDLTEEINPDTGKPYFKRIGYHEDIADLKPGEHAAKTCQAMLSYIYQEHTGKYPNDSDSESAREQVKELQFLASVTQDKLMDVQNLSYKLFGVKPVVDSKPVERLDYDAYTSREFTLEKDVDTNSSLDYVLANLNMATINVGANRHVAYNADSNVKSNINKHGDDYSQNFSYYFPLEAQRNANYRRTCVYSSRGNTYTKDQLNAQIQRQLDKVPRFSADYINSLKDYYNAKGNYDPDTIADLTMNHSFDDAADPNNSDALTLQSIAENPLKDVIFAQTKSILENVPRMDTEKLPSLLQRRFDYVPYDFSVAQQPRFLKPKKPKVIDPATSELRAAREALLKAANCSIATEDADTSLAMRKEFFRRWDYSSHNNTDPDGVVHQKMFDGGAHSDGYDRRALFNSRFFKVKNSNMEEGFTSYKTELEADGVDTTPMELFSATSYGSTAGILGASGGWFMGNQYTKAGKALGCGAYFGYTGGKCSVYCGDQAYANIHTDAYGDSANGCFILASVMRGRRTDSTSAGSRFRDFEIAVHTNKCILPHHFVDISCRALGKNVKRDGKGNYLDKDGNITHDRYGTKIDME